MRSFFHAAVLAVVAMLSLSSPGFAAEGKTHRLAIHVDQNDPAVMNLALNNATNVIEYYRGKGESADVTPWEQKEYLDLF